MKLELLIKDKAGEKIASYTNVVKFARIIQYLIIKCQKIYVQDDIDILKIKFLHDYNEFNNLFSSYTSKYNEPWEYEQGYNQIIFQHHSSNGISHLLDTAFWNYAWPHAPENKQRITSSEYDNFTDFVDNTLVKDYSALNYSTALLKIAALKNEREKFLGFINVLSLLLCTKREKMEGDEKNIESLFKKGELQSCYTDYFYMIHYYRAKYLIQRMEYKQALKELKEALPLSYSRDGIFLELIINDRCLLSAFLSYRKKANIEPFMLFYETGLWYGFLMNLPGKPLNIYWMSSKKGFYGDFHPATTLKP